MVSFRSCVSESDYLNSPLWQEMAMGQGSSTLLLEITQPMANLLSCLPGDYMRARGLDWLLFDGMKQAIVGRQKLCDLVNKQLSTGNVVGEARNAFNYGRDPWQQGDPIEPCDLFSPEAHERVPELSSLKIQGLSIEQYYDKYFEPKTMTIDIIAGKPANINLVFLREFIESRGMQPFRYGGFDGYLQTIEKGDSLPDYKKQFYDDNQQYGPDLRLDTENGNEDDAETLVNGTPTLHLVGGSINKNENRSAKTIKKMQGYFTHVASQLEQGKDVSDMDPRVVDQIKSMINSKNLIQKAEISLKGEGAGKGKIAAKMGIPTGTHSDEGMWYVPEALWGDGLKSVLKIFKQGLNQPTNPKNLAAIPDPSKFGPEWDGVGPEPDGWHRMVGNKIIIKFSKADQAAIYDYMVAQPLKEYSALRLRPDWVQIPSLRNRVHSDSGRFSFSTICNTGEKINPEVAKDIKRVTYSMKDIDYRSFMKEADVTKQPIENVQDPQNDPVLSYLWDKGYRWVPQDKSEEKTRSPNWVSRDYGILGLKTSTYRVVREGDKYFLLVPNGADGKPISPATHGLAGNANLAGGHLAFTGHGGHVFTKPAGPRVYSELLEKLMNGEMGERGGANSEESLPCVKAGIKNAISQYNRKKHGEAAAINWSDGEQELLSWGVQGLRATSGLPEFQVGFLSQDQIENILKWNAETQWRYAEKGWGIDALLNTYGVTDPDQKEEVIQMMIDQMRENPIIDTSFLTPQQQAAIGDNAYKARVRMIAGYVFNLMSRETGSKKAKELRAERGESQLGGRETENGRGGSILDTGKKIVRLDSDWEAPEEFRGRVDYSNLRSKLGVKTPENPEQDSAKTAQKPRISLGSQNAEGAPRSASNTVKMPKPVEDDFANVFNGEQKPAQPVLKPKKIVAPQNKPVVSNTVKMPQPVAPKQVEDDFANVFNGGEVQPQQPIAKTKKFVAPQNKPADDDFFKVFFGQ